jgi:glycosyltransferase involved in cell wall biosynthesis
LFTKRILLAPSNATADGERRLNLLLVSAESMAEGYAAYTRIHGNLGMLRTLGHEVYIVGEDDGPYFQSSLLQRMRRYVRVNRKVMAKLDSCDAIIARGHFAHLPWVWAARRKAKPVLYEMNGFVFDAMTTYEALRVVQPLIKRAYMLQFRMATTILCLSDEIADHIRKLGSYPSVLTVTNGVDAKLFHPANEDQTDNYAVFPSSLAPWHGTEALLDAVDDPAWPDGLKLVIAGDGVQAPLVRERAAGNPRIDYLGLLDRTRLAEVLRQASIGLCLVQPVGNRGVSEVYPLKLFEMMASGLPIVATDLPGQRDVVLESGAGSIVPVGDPGEIAKAVRALYDNPRRRDIGLAAAAAVRQRFEWRYGATLMKRILREAVPRRSGD